MNEKTGIEVLGVPIDLGVAKLGVDMGPTAIRYAGIFEAFAYAGFDYKDLGDVDVVTNFSLDHLPAHERKQAKLAETIRVAEVVAEKTTAVMKRGNLPLVLGGDHSTAIGSVAGIAAATERLGVLWIDAHPDVNTPETSLSGNVHGMPLAISLGHGHKALTHCAGFGPKVRPEDVVILGAKDIDPAEARFIQDNGIAMFTTFDIQEQGIATVMDQVAARLAHGPTALHVSFDADVIDMKFAPGTGIMTRGGLNYREISFIAEYIGRKLPVSALDVIEVNPLMDKRNMTAELVVELAMAMLGVRYSDYERNYMKNNQPPGHMPAKE